MWTQLKLIEGYHNTSLKKSLSAAEVKRLANLQKKVFIYSSSEYDEKYFRQAMVNYLINDSHNTLTDAMFTAVWERNNCGETGKYTYFNEQQQRVYLDRSFWQWCKLTCQLLSSQVELLSSL